MFFGKSPTQGVNFNTNFFSSFSDTAALIVGGWNNQLSIKMKPAIGKDPNGIRQYADDRSQTITTSITIENALTLYNAFEKEVLPAINHQKESGSASIVMGNAENRKILTLGYDGKNSYLAIATNLDSTGKAEYELRHVFNKRGYLTNYVANQGNATEHEYEAEMFSFVEKLKHINDLVPMSAHAANYSKLVREQFGGNGGSSASAQSQRASQMPAYEPPVSSIGGIGDLPF